MTELEKAERSVYIMLHGKMVTEHAVDHAAILICEHLYPTVDCKQLVGRVKKQLIISQESWLKNMITLRKGD